MTDPIWTDETEANYRKWHKERYGVEPPEVKLPIKEESMKKDKIPEGFHEHAIGIHEDHEESSVGVADVMEMMGVPQGIPAADINTNPEEPQQPSKAHRTRRPKGLPDNVTVETYQEATVHVEIPARPEGMKKVTIAIHSHYDNDPIFIDWPEGVTDIEAFRRFKSFSVSGD